MLLVNLEPFHNTLNQLRVPCASARCFYFPLVQLSGNTAPAIRIKPQRY
jgi:hypothetical protein